MKSVTFEIDGMHCGGCVETVNAALGADRGVHAAEVSLERREARVLYDGALANAEQIAAAIENAGFRVATRRAGNRGE